MNDAEGYLANISEQIAEMERRLKILKAERAAHILGLRRSGVSMTNIARAADLTRQRVLQLVQKYEGKNAAR